MLTEMARNGLAAGLTRASRLTARRRPQDGFEDNTGLVVLAATNRPAVLDRALTRPGRFDRWLRVPLPDLAGRVEILLVHARGKAVAPDADWGRLARATAGWSGADLACLMNEAAISTARAGEALISNDRLFEAVDNLRRDPASGNMMLAVAARARAGGGRGRLAAGWARSLTAPPLPAPPAGC